MEDKTTEKVNPKTGLTIKKDKPSGLNAKQLVEYSKRNPTRYPSLGGGPTQGTFGDYGPGAIITPDRNFNEIRAQEQSALDLAFGASTQMAATVLGGAIEGTGYLGEALLELGTGQRGATPEEYEAGAVARLGKGIQEWAREVAPIYQTELAQSGEAGRFIDPTFWAGNSPSIASTLALMAPGLLAAKGMSVLGNLAKAGKGAKAFMATAGATVASREAEARMESGEIYEQELQKYLGQGIPEPEAEQLAKRTADDVYAGSYSNIMLDAVQWGIGLRGVKWSSRRANQKLLDIAEQSDDDIVNIIKQGILKNPDSSVKELVTKYKPWADFVGQAGLEGWEEFNIEVQKQRAIRNSQILTGETEGELRNFMDVYTSGDFKELITPEAINATVFGAIGGGVVGGAQRGFAKYKNRQSQEFEIKQADILRQQAQRVQQGLQNIERFLQEGDEVAAKEEQRMMIKDLAIKGKLTEEGRIQGSANAGTLDYNKQMFEAIAQLDESQLEEMGLGAQAKEQAQESLKELERVEEIYERNQKKSYGTKYDDVINAYISEQEYMNDIQQRTIDDYAEEIAQIRSDESITQLLNELSPSQRSFIETEKELSDLKKIKHYLDETKTSHAVQSPARIGVFKKARQAALRRVEKRIAELEQDVEDAQGEDGMLKKDISQARKTAKTLYSTLDLGAKETSKRLREVNLAEGKSALGKLLESDNQSQIIRNIEAKDEEIKQIVSEYIMDEEYGEGAIVKRPDEDQLYKLRKVDDTYEIQPVDNELNYIEGSTAETVSDPEDFIQTMELMEYESTMTQKEFELTVAEIENDLDQDNVTSAFERLGRILNTPFAGDTESIQGALYDRLKKRIASMESIDEIEHFFNNLDYVIKNDTLKRTINFAIKSRIEEYKAVNQKRRERFRNLITEKREEAGQISKKLDSISQEIDSIQSEVRQYEQKLQETAERKNRTQKDIMETHKSIREPLLKAREKISDELSNLRGMRKKLKSQLNEINKDLSVMEKLEAKIERDKSAFVRVITTNELNDLLGEVESIRASTLLDFNLNEENILNLRNLYEEGLVTATKSIDLLEKYKNFVNDLIGGNEVATKAAERAFETLKEDEEFQSEEAILAEDVLSKYERLYNKYLTQEIKKYTHTYQGMPKQLRRIGNLMRFRLSGDNIAEFVEGYLSDYKQQIEENIPRLLELNRTIQVYESVLDAMNKKEADPSDPDIDKGKGIKSSDKFIPMRHPYEIWNGLAGDTGDTDAGLSEDPAMRRYGRFVNYNDINEMANQGKIHIEIVKPEDVGISLEGLPEKYDKQEVLYALTVNEGGEYYLEDGTTTEEFNPDENIYTSVPEATVTSHKLPKSYVINEDGEIQISDEEVKRLHPDKPVKAGRKIVKRRIKQLQKQHQQFRDYVFSELEKGNKVTRRVRGKSFGVLKETKEGRGPKPIAKRFDKKKILNGDIELHVLGTNNEVIRDYRIKGKRGYTVLIDEYGNAVPLERRNLREAEVDVLVESLKYAVENGTKSKDGKKLDTTVDLPGLEKEVNDKTLPVYFNDLFKYYVRNLKDKNSPIRFVGSQKPGGAIRIRRFDENSNEVFETYDLLADSKEGDKKIQQLNPALEKALREVLPETSMNVLSAKTNEGGSDVNSVFNHYTYEDGQFKQKQYKTYRHFLLEEEVVGTYLDEAEDVPVTEDRTEIGTEKGLTHYNQRLFYDNSIEEVEQQETEEKSALDQLRESKSGLDILRESQQEKDTEKDDLDSLDEFFSEQDQAESEELSDEELGSALDDLRKSLDEADEDTDEDAPFQKTSGQPELSSQQVGAVSKMLSNRTGIPIHIMSKEKSLYFLNHLYDIGEVDQKFTEETLPKGMNYKGVAYVFSDKGISRDTPFHEVIHPIVSQIIADNPALIENLREEIIDSPEGRKIIQRVVQNYPDPLRESGGLKNWAWAEVITTAIGEQAADKYYGRANQGLIGLVKRFWEHIKQFLRERFGEGYVQIENLSSNTTLGDIASLLAESRKKFIVTPSTVTQFQREDSSHPILENIEPKHVLPGTTSEFTRQTVQALNFFFFNELFQNRRKDLASLFTKEGMSPEVYNDILNDSKKSFKKYIQNRINQIEKSGDKLTRSQLDKFAEIVDNYSYVLKNFSEVAKLHRNHLLRYNIAPIEDAEFVTENVKDANELWTTEGLKYSSKRNATSDIRMLIGTLRSSEKNRGFLVPKNVDFATTFNILANRLANTTSLSEMKEIVETSLSTEDGMKDLLDRFLSDLDNPDSLTRGQALSLLKFRKTFAKNFNNYYVLMMREEVEEGEHNFTILNAHESTTKRKILEDWRSNVNPSNPNFRDEGGVVTYDIESMKKRGLIKEGGLRNNDYYLPSNPDRYSMGELEDLRTANFLAELGIEFTNIDFTDDIHHAADYIYEDIYKEESMDILSDELSDHRRNAMIRFVNHEADTARARLENSHTRSTGETIYNVNLYSHLTHIVNKLNDFKYETKEQLLNDLPHYAASYVRNSKVLNEFLFDEDGQRTTNELKVTFVDEYKNDATYNSDTFDNLSPSDKALVTLNLALNNSFPVFRAGDNSIERHIEMPEFFTSVQIKNGEHLFPKKDSEERQITMRDYLHDEINEIIDIRARNKFERYDLSNTESVERLMEMSPIINLLSQDSRLKSSIEKAINGDKSGISDLDFGKRMRKVFGEFFNEQVENTEQFLLDHKIIEERGNQYLNKGLSGLTVNDKKYHKQTELRDILRKIMVNRFIANIEQTKLLTGPVIYYRDADNFFKRMSGIVGTKESLAVGDTENKMLNKLFPRNSSNQRLYKHVQDGQLTDETSAYSPGAKPILRSSVFQDPKITSTYINELEKLLDDASAYRNMDEADAVGFISLDGYRDMMLRAGMWDMYLERLYQWETRGNQDSITFYNWHLDKPEVINHPSQLVNPNGKRTVFNVMKPQYFGPLAEEGFIPGMYKTALLPVLPSYTEGNPAMKQLMDYQNNFNIDLVTFPSANKVGTKLNEEGTIPGLFDKDGDIAGGTFQDTFYEYWGVQLDTGTAVKEKVIKGTQLMKLIFSNIYDQGNVANEELAESAGHLTSINNALIEKGVEELKEDLGFQVDEDGNYILDEEKITEQINFLQNEANKRNVNNNVLDSLEFLRDNFTSSYAKFDMMSNRDKIENILASIADDRVISQKMPGGPKVQVPVTTFKDGLYRYTNDEAYKESKKLKFYEEEGVMEVLLPHHFKKWADNVDVEQQLKKGIAFRIPTSGLNSAEHIKIVGYLPQAAGETIVVPSEIVAKAGSDFDVDKLNVFLPNYEIVDGKPHYIEFDKSKGYAENSREALENELIKTMGEIISHPDNRSQLLESIGNTDIKAEEQHIVKKMGFDQEPKNATDIVGNFGYYMNVTNRNIESKQLTGVAALHTADHPHATRYGYQMSSKYKIHLPHNETEDGNISLGHQETVDGHKISSLLNQMINTAVDGAKEPIFYNLNMNLETANVIFYLTRAGVSPRNVFEFVNEPIVREYVNTKRAANSITSYNINMKAEEADIRKKYNEKEGEILDKYKQYDQDSMILNNYMQSTRIDTQAMGKNTSELDFVLHNVNKVVNEESGIINANKLFEEGGFLQKHYQALQSIDQMYSEMFITRKNEDFLAAYDQVLEHIADKKISLDRKVKILDKLKADFITSRVLLNNTKIMNEETLPIQYHDHLIRGKNTVAKRLQKYQKTQEGRGNSFVQSLQPVIGKTKQKFVVGYDNNNNQILKEDFIDGVKLFTQRMDTLDENDLIDSAREFAGNRPELFRDLVRLSFLQGGLQFTPMRFINLIPAEVYIQAIETGLRNSSNERFNVARFIRNFIGSNYADRYIVSPRSNTDDFIYKRPIKKRLTKEKLKEAIKEGKSITQGKPVLHVRQDIDAEQMNIFGEFKKIEGSNPIFQHPAIRDNVNNIAYMYYGDFGKLVPSDTEGAGQTIEETESTVSTREAIRKINKCR